MKFSQCGQLLATAGQDTILRIWVLKNSYSYFDEMRNRYNADVKSSSSPTNSYENVIMDQMTSEVFFKKDAKVRNVCKNDFFFQGQKSPGFHGKAILSVFWSHLRFVRCLLVQKLFHPNLIHG